MPYTLSERVLALAGLHQAVHCVVHIARTGSADASAMEPCIHSLFQVDAETVESVFGEPGALVTGVRQLIVQLTGQPERDFELTRHMALLIRLERQLSARPDLLERLSDGIEAARSKREHLELLHPSLLTHFAELYAETISLLSPRVMVSGEPDYLRDTDNQNRIRALLLGGIRAARLWRQLGGSRWQFLFQGQRIVEEARLYLDRHAVV